MFKINSKRESCEQELVKSRLSVNAANVSVSIIGYNLRLAEL